MKTRKVVGFDTAPLLITAADHWSPHTDHRSPIGKQRSLALGSLAGCSCWPVQVARPICLPKSTLYWPVCVRVCSVCVVCVAAAAYKAINNPRIFNSWLETAHETMSWFIPQLSLFIREERCLRVCSEPKHLTVCISGCVCNHVCVCVC